MRLITSPDVVGSTQGYSARYGVGRVYGLHRYRTPDNRLWRCITWPCRIQDEEGDDGRVSSACESPGWAVNSKAQGELQPGYITLFCREPGPRCIYTAII